MNSVVQRELYQAASTLAVLAEQVRNQESSNQVSYILFND